MASPAFLKSHARSFENGSTCFTQESCWHLAHLTSRTQTPPHEPSRQTVSAACHLAWKLAEIESKCHQTLV